MNQSDTSQKPRVVIAGAGLAGCLLARLLGREGFEVLVVERREDPRTERLAGGRSINLAISARGIDALRAAGLEDELMKHAIPMTGRMIHSGSDNETFQSYSADSKKAINSVSRSELNLLLLDGADECDTVTFRFGQACTGVDPLAGSIGFRDSEGCETVEKADVIVGADGAYSAVRSALQRTPRFSFSQDFLDHGYKELSIPPAEKGPHAPWAIDPKALHIWPHGGSMMIALPNLDGSFTCTLFWPYEGFHSFESVKTDEVRRFFDEHYPDASELMPDLEDQYERNPVGPLGTMRCRPWNRNGVVLIGDSAHAIVPFYGQGANASFEDAKRLAEGLIADPDNPIDAIESYYVDRVDHGNAIADLALANFIEMRDHTGKTWFKWKKRLEHALHTTLGDRFLPLYEMVSFSTIPYDDARKRARWQWRLLLSFTGFGLITTSFIMLIVFIMLQER
ncbi:MAG: kynurenine 3-monooxygenase [Phycisphaerae bacterium]|nr:kynurenine 3-monooxygenase [Phycisphaerae bacterium]HAW95215.1 FAD-dependent monooxygenase [Phycisphaerales bacterium]